MEEMTPLYNMYMARQMNTGSAINPRAMTPMEKMRFIMQAMINPAATVRSVFKDIPAQYQDPAQILQYIQQTRNISNEKLNEFMSTMPKYPY